MKEQNTQDSLSQKASFLAQETYAARIGANAIKRRAEQLNRNTSSPVSYQGQNTELGVSIAGNRLAKTLKAQDYGAFKKTQFTNGFLIT